MFSKLTLVLSILLWITPAMGVHSATHEENKIKKEINNLDRLYIRLSSEIYKTTKLKPGNTYTKIKNIKSLHESISFLVEKGNHIKAIQLIQYHNKLIQKNIDDPAIFHFLELLLDHNEWNTANSLYQYIKTEGDKSLISNVKFIFSRYYFNRSNWKKTLNTLDGIYDDLSADNGHYALVMNGVALQNIRKHREALKYYNKVSSESVYYHYAKLNTAIAYIRQGWWSDAHIIISALLKAQPSSEKENKEFINRLYLVLGYSFLQQEYFREARESFRNIQKNSRYAIRGMLGIALAAASQGDNTGALNILNLLQQKDAYALPVEESYLLLPYVYEKLGQHKTAAASYSIALDYYQKRIHEINSVSTNIRITSDALSTIKNNTFTINRNKIDLSQKHLVLFINNLKELERFKSITATTELQNKITSLITKHHSLLKSIVLAELKKRTGYLKSYRNQAQYGLARLYDNSKQK